ncbi:MAG: helix-turn-helix domain-containing protein [Treponema sp.]|jgi:transcriptional regulator with XRE-family HTH domain|nr:helix-turn-helix domain-containing protein [Treponema sp.]
MGFKENLKAELAYRDIRIKELAMLSGLSRRTIDNYMREDASMPSIDAAVRIAGALGVTVEYLVTGREENGQSLSPLSDPQAVLRNLESLNRRDLAIVVNLIKVLKNMEETERRYIV